MSKQAIIDKIIAGAELTAKSLERETESKVSEEFKTLSGQLDAFAARQKDAVDSEAAAIVLRRKKVAELDAQKLVLSVRRGIVDAVFSSAAEKLSALPDAKYTALIAAMLLKFASDGDTVVVSEKDKRRLTKEFLDKTAAARKIKLALSKEYGDFSGGFILKNAAFDQNLTLENLIAGEKESLEADAVRLTGV